MLRIDKIDVFYGDVQILWDVSLEVERKEIVTVLGPNGSGKSTLLRTIVNLIHPKKAERSDGGIFYQGSRINGLSPEETVKLGISIVPEGARVFQEMSVLDNLKNGILYQESEGGPGGDHGGDLHSFPQTPGEKVAEGKDPERRGTEDVGFGNGPHVKAGPSPAG